MDASGAPTDARRYYSQAGAPTVVRSTGGSSDMSEHHLSVLLSDHQGTATTAVSLDTDMTVQRRKFDPFGNPRGEEPSQWPGRDSFLGTGIDDPLTGLTHIGAREYDASTGRFLSVDPVIDMTDPQQMNGYAYADNNPTTHSDPTGLILAGCAHREFSCHQGQPTDIVPGSDNCYTGNWSASCDWAQPGGSGINPNGPVRGNHSSHHAGSHRSGHHVSSSGPSRSEVRKAQRIKKKTFLEVVTHVGWEIFKDYIGWNDLTGCIKGGVSSCVSLLLDVIPWTALIKKGAKFVRGAWRIGKALLKWKKDRKWADDILEQAASCLKRNSFIAGTKVLLADGTKKPIEKLNPGDKVIATDPHSGKTTVKAATATILTTDDEHYVDISVRDQQGSTGSLTTTAHHPFWSVTAHAWKDAATLKPGTKLREDDGTTTTIQSVRTYTALQDTYNLTVADLHTYYVLAGETPVLVHNATPGQKCDLTLGAGPNAREGVGLENGDIEADGVRDLVNESGNKYGCHTCDATTPGTKDGDWIPDHQPPSSLVAPGSPQTAYPHCLPCARRQGGVVSQLSQGKSKKEW